MKFAPCPSRAWKGRRHRPSMETRLTKLLDIEAPIMVAGMAPTTGPELAAVSPEAHPRLPTPEAHGAAAVD
eukprot:COSAG04_NODE_861_length_9806_cov_5.052127_11_plen_71_part_00